MHSYTKDFLLNSSMEKYRDQNESFVYHSVFHSLQIGQICHQDGKKVTKMVKTVTVLIVN